VGDLQSEWTSAGTTSNGLFRRRQRTIESGSHRNSLAPVARAASHHRGTFRKGIVRVLETTENNSGTSTSHACNPADGLPRRDFLSPSPILQTCRMANSCPCARWLEEKLPRRRREATSESRSAPRMAQLRVHITLGDAKRRRSAHICRVRRVTSKSPKPKLRVALETFQNPSPRSRNSNSAVHGRRRNRTGLGRRRSPPTAEVVRW